MSLLIDYERHTDGWESPKAVIGDSKIDTPPVETLNPSQQTGGLFDAVRRQGLSMSGAVREIRPNGVVATTVFVRGTAQKYVYESLEEGRTTRGYVGKFTRSPHAGSQGDPDQTEFVAYEFPPKAPPNGNGR